jgi:hypothetical protein
LKLGKIKYGIKFLLLAVVALTTHVVLSLFRALLGPTAGGVLVDKFGFNWSATGCAGLITLSVSLSKNHVLFM